MKIWLDDVRDPKDYLDDHKEWLWCKTEEEAKHAIGLGKCTEISLDHDLGDDGGTGYGVAIMIESLAWAGVLNRIKWKIHSSNPVGKANMHAAMTNADKYWTENGN